MSNHYESPKRDCSKCTGNTFPNGCAGYCDIFESEEEEVIDISCIFEEERERALREAEARAEDGPQPPY